MSKTKRTLSEPKSDRGYHSRQYIPVGLNLLRFQLDYAVLKGFVAHAKWELEWMECARTYAQSFDTYRTLDIKILFRKPTVQPIIL